MYVRIEYDNGYCGCNESEVMKVDTLEEAEEYAQEGIYDYGQTYEHCAEGYDSDEGWLDEEEEEYYYENLSFTVTEITKEEFENEN